MSVANELLNLGALDTHWVLNALTAVKNGDFSVRLPAHWTGIDGKIADTFNEVVSQNDRITKELDRVSRGGDLFSKTYLFKHPTVRALQPHSLGDAQRKKETRHGYH